MDGNSVWHTKQKRLVFFPLIFFFVIGKDSKRFRMVDFELKEFEIGGCNFSWIFFSDSGDGEETEGNVSESGTIWLSWIFKQNNRKKKVIHHFEKDEQKYLTYRWRQIGRNCNAISCHFRSSCEKISIQFPKMEPCISLFRCHEQNDLFQVILTRSRIRRCNRCFFFHVVHIDFQVRKKKTR